MSRHIIANLWLLVVTLLLCSVAYPLVLWVVGQTVFADQADGSLLRGADGKVVGSRLIAQPFGRDEHFWPRPSAVSYNAAASGATNWSASNPLLRDRVARQLGPIVKYRAGPKKGQLVGPDVEVWFRSQAPDFVAKWAGDHAAVAEQWTKDNAEAVARWLGKDTDEVKNQSADVTKIFFDSYVQKHPGTWPDIEEVKGADGKAVKQIKSVRASTGIQAYFFDQWLQSRPDGELEQVPGDMVMASGSGLDPHITLANAFYQLERVASAWAKKTKEEPARIRKEISELLLARAEAPLGGFVGVELINVLEINLALDHHFASKLGGAS
jgi:K+-transporting ATPase ATPase C chain